MRSGTISRNSGFTLAEMLVATVIGALLMTAVLRLWKANQSETNRIQDKTDFRDKATLATTKLNRSITMAGFGITKMDVIQRRAGTLSDTLTIYSNESELRTTLRDSAKISGSYLMVFKDTGFTEGGMLGITDSINQEYATIAAISGDTANGFRIELSSGLQNTYLPGVPDIYPVQKEIIYIDGSTSSLVRKVGQNRQVLSDGITDFRVDMRDGSGNIATYYRNIRVITFSMMGTYKAPSGTPNQMRFSSTVIPRNLL